MTGTSENRPKPKEIGLGRTGLGRKTHKTKQKPLKIGSFREKDPEHQNVGAEPLVFGPATSSFVKNGGKKPKVGRKNEKIGKSVAKSETQTNQEVYKIDKFSK